VGGKSLARRRGLSWGTRSSALEREDEDYAYRGRVRLPRSQRSKVPAQAADQAIEEKCPRAAQRAPGFDSNPEGGDGAGSDSPAQQQAAGLGEQPMPSSRQPDVRLCRQEHLQNPMAMGE